MLTAVTHFQVPGLWINTELLGTRNTTTFRGRPITLVLPDGPADLVLNKTDSDVRIFGVYRHYSGQGPSATDVLLVRVEVGIDEDLAELGVPARDLFMRGTSILTDAVQTAQAFMQEYLSLVRSQLDQYWVGPSALQLDPVQTCELRDSDGRNIPAEYMRKFRIKGPRTPELAVSTSVQKDLMRQVSEGVKAGIAETFLSDAKFIGLESDHPDLRQAILLAAIACEVKVKEVLITLASTEQKRVLNLLLENPRDWSMGAAALFDKGMDAICNRSLRRESKALYKDIELLFQNRNRIAHRGGAGISNDEELKGHLTAATYAFIWLNNLHTENAQSEGKSPA
jgi:hypothetical protein